jgi:hypothetical protein
MHIAYQHIMFKRNTFKTWYVGKCYMYNTVYMYRYRLKCCLRTVGRVSTEGYVDVPYLRFIVMEQLSSTKKEVNTCQTIFNIGQNMAQTIKETSCTYDR